MYKKICKYLKDHNLDFDGFDLTDNGNGVVISRQEYEISKPTEEDLNAISEAEADCIFYADKRRAAYPDIGEQLDAFVKGFNQLRLQNITLPSELDSVINQCLSVKKKYPKPEG